MTNHPIVERAVRGLINFRTSLSALGCVFVRRETAGFGLLVVMFMFLLVLEPLPVHAAATLIQQNNNGCLCSSNPAVVTVTLGSVASGDVIVVGLEFPSLYSSLISLTDTLHSSFTQAVTAPSLGHTAAIYTATLSSGGADTVTATFTNTISPPNYYDVFVYEVAGVTTTGAATGTGTGTSTSVSTSSVSFQAGAFLFGMIYDAEGTPATAGPGFTLSTENLGVGVSNGQFSDPVSSPTTFPATLSSSTNWIEAGIALNPAPPIPEYPLGLPILAIFMIFGYAVIRRKNITKQK